MKTPDPNPNELSPLDSSVLDRLVDGELEAEQRRDLIRQLDASPDGWRHCAFAFLEAQAFREAFGEIISEAGTSPQRLVGARRPGPSWAAWRGLAIAAGLVVAFGLGMLVAPRAGEPLGPGPSSVASRNTQDRPREALAVGADGAEEGAGELWVPVVEAEEGDPMWRWLEESLAAEELIARLEAEGHYVSKTRQLVPITLPDGRPAVLPVDEVEVRPVVYRTYH